MNAEQSESARTEQPVALVTGAGSGIGRETCILLSREEYRIALVGRTGTRLDHTIEQLDGNHSNTALKLPLDIADPDQAVQSIDRTINHFGRLDVLINNAGAAESVPIDQVTQGLLDRIFAVNAFGPAHLITRAWPAFLTQGGGCVINVSTMSTIDPFPGLAAYAAAKAALESLTRSIMSEGYQRNIRAYTVAPGAVETTMLRGLVSEKDLPQSRTLNPVDVARVIVDCVLGKREDDVGRIIRLPNP